MKNTTNFLKNKKGEAYIDTAFKILIAVVVGALLFTSIYALFNDTILTKLTEKVNTIFATGTSLEMGNVPYVTSNLTYTSPSTNLVV